MTYRSRAWFAVLVVGALLSACSSERDPAAQGPDGSSERVTPIIIGSFDFSESHVLAEIYGAVLEDHGYSVRQLRNVASREIMEPALEQHFVDFVPEYQGTALTFLGLGGTVRAGPRETHRRLAGAFADRGVEVLRFSPAENKNEVVVTKATADQYGLRTISDLRTVAPRMVFGGPAECPARPLCLEGLEERYGLRFQSFQPLDVGGPLTVGALEGGEIDAALLFTTSPAIATNEFVVLEDDWDLQPSENVVPVVREQVAEAYGTEFSELVNSVTARLDATTLRALNERVEIYGEDPGDVARDWIARENLDL